MVDEQNIKSMNNTLDPLLRSELPQIMRDHELWLSYKGELTKTITTTFRTMAENKLSSQGSEASLNMELFDVMADCMHSFCSKGQTEESWKDGIFVLGRIDDLFTIYFGTEVDRTMVSKYENLVDNFSIESSNNISNNSEETSALYKLIHMAKESGCNIEYQTDHLNDSVSFFSIKTSMHYA